MAIPNLDKAQKYEFQCDLAHAILALTHTYKNPDIVTHFLAKWPLSEDGWKELDKHLKHGVNLLSQLLHETGTKDCLPHEEALSKIQESIEVHNLICATDAIALCDLLKLGGVDCAVLKGISYYLLSNRSYFRSRLSSDIDLLISKEDLMKAVKILEKDGYQVIANPFYRTLEAQTSNYYEYTLVKKREALKPEIGLHWTIPKGDIKKSQDGFYFETLTDTQIKEMLHSKKEIKWKGLPVSVLSAENLMTNFLFNVDRDFMGQINIIRWIRAAKDFYELSQIFPGISFENCVRNQNKRIQNQTAALHQFSGALFSEKNKMVRRTSIPDLFYSSLKTWVTDKHHAQEVWLALALSKKRPFLFRIFVKIYTSLKQLLGERKLP